MVAISGIEFAALFIVNLLLIRLAVPTDANDSGVWRTDPVSREQVMQSLNLVPVAGLACLWYIAVMRQHFGLLRNRVLATVFRGSGLLFVTMMVVATAS